MSASFEAIREPMWPVLLMWAGFATLLALMWLMLFGLNRAGAPRWAMSLANGLFALAAISLIYGALWLLER